MKLLIQRIKEHNYLNGFKFVIAEFGIFILIILPFTLYYLLHNNFIFGVIGLGLIANFMVVLVFAVGSVLRKETSVGINKVYSKKYREEINQKYPQLTNDTFILFAALIIPFILLIVVCAELLFPGQKV